MSDSAFMAFPTGMLIATLVSAVGIGGGILWMPVFLLFFHLPPETAVITSLLVQTAGMGSGSAAFIRKRVVDLRLAGCLLLLTLPGLGLGALLTRQLTPAHLELVLGILTLTTRSCSYRPVSHTRKPEPIGSRCIVCVDTARSFPAWPSPAECSASAWVNGSSR